MDLISGRDALLDLTGGDAWVRWGLPSEPGEIWVHRGVVMVERPAPRPGFWVITPGNQSPPTRHAGPDDVTAALRELRDGGHLQRLGAASLSIEQQWSELVPPIIRVDAGGRWEWHWTTTMPAPGRSPQDPDVSAIVELDDHRDAEEITAFLHTHNHRVWQAAGTGLMELWLGVREHTGALLAVGAMMREDSGAPHLGSIVTHTDHRGRGLGHLVSAALTRRGIADHGVCTLGMYSDNDAARRVYERIGYRCAHAWHSRSIVPNPPDRAVV